ncbi:DinB family protein [Thalassoroseus pseudoceratinae]|uniref:DinB family protein n=1 Tax=Thalassoroseus pseudoceratinae TaxID=2713176 RepID=UPI001423BE9B|nr:DinB family protein [Thalassoroseus pseudoceratinae]
MTRNELIDQYLAGPEMLVNAIEGMNAEQLNQSPIPGQWSTQQIVCHIADFEPIYADRMKRVIAEDNPTFFGGDPDVFAAGLAYSHRTIQNELQLINATREQIATILRTLSPSDFQRIGTHSEDGPLSLEKLLQNITNHIPHHCRFIKAKREAMRL